MAPGGGPSQPPGTTPPGTAPPGTSPPGTPPPAVCPSNRPDDPDCCGPRKLRCPDVIDADRTCVMDRCGHACKAPALTCQGASACEPATWSFETDTGGWTRFGSQDTTPLEGPLEPSSELARTGQKSLASDLIVQLHRGVVQIKRDLCGFALAQVGPLRALDLRGKTLSFWMFVGRDSGEGFRGRCTFGAWGGTDGTRPIGFGKETSVVADRWTEIKTSITEEFAAQVSTLELRCAFLADTATFTGRLFIDDITITPR